MPKSSKTFTLALVNFPNSAFFLSKKKIKKKRRNQLEDIGCIGIGIGLLQCSNLKELNLFLRWNKISCQGGIEIGKNLQFC